MNTLIKQLMEIPREATAANIQGIEMQIIDVETSRKMLRSDSAVKYHECLMENGSFIISKQEGHLKELYKIKDSPTGDMLRNFCK